MSNNSVMEKLKAEYYDLVRNGLSFQRNRDIKSFTMNALKAENVAQKIQAFSRRH